jgi:cell division septation protein DedD
MKNLWLVLVLVAAGVVVFSLSLGHKPQGDSVALSEVFKQTPQPQAQPAEGSKLAYDPVPSPAIITNPSNGHEEDFSVQVYSFHDNSRAEKALAALKEAGYDKAFMEMSDLGEKGVWYRVRIGGLATEAQARTVLEDVRKNYNSGFIIKPKK